MERSTRRLVAGLATALGGALLVIAFLLGRMTANRAESPRPPVAGMAQPAALITNSSADGQGSPGPTTADAYSPRDPPPIENVVAPAVPPRGLETGNTATPIAAGHPVASPSTERQQVAAYFDQINRTGDVGSGDPQAFAASLLQSLSSGDFSGFDRLATLARAQRERIRNLTPPPACLEHHRLAVALASDSAAMLDRLRAAISRGDTVALMTMAAESRALETQANQLQAMGEAIRQRVGI